jgi:hypothetical protein
MTATSFTPGFGTVLAPASAGSTRAIRVKARTSTRVKVLRVLIAFGFASAVAGAALVWAGSYTHDMIRDQLVAQQIQFPPAGSPAMTAEAYPGLQQYGGKLIDDGPKAKAWANQFMAPHILELSGGLPYGVYSAKAFQNPQDEKMAATSKSMAIGEMQRGLLLSAWGWWTVGTVTWTAGLVLIVLGGVALVVGTIVRIRSPRSAAG